MFARSSTLKLGLDMLSGMNDTNPAATITQIIHDLRSRTSHVVFVWKDQEEKKLGLPVPFGTKVEDIEHEAAKAIQSFQGELASLTIKVP